MGWTEKLYGMDGSFFLYRADPVQLIYTGSRDHAFRRLWYWATVSKGMRSLSEIK